MAKLSSRSRNKLSKRSFAIPGKRAYPIHDRAHASNALARSANKSPAVRAKVRAAVCRRYPTLPSCK
jgi:hypothetical protein